MTSIIYNKTFDEPEIDKREILRYAGVRGEAELVEALLDDCIRESSGRLSYRVCYREIDLNSTLPAFLRSDSYTLKKNLRGCDGVILFAATVGIEMDRLINKYGKLSPARSVMLDALGSERIEALCDTFEDAIRMEYAELGIGVRTRFSPGYGDFGLSAQSEIFELLLPEKKIGLTLNKSMLMSPTKSVTALMGISHI
ncbi:MAG: Vitamin B12 dependent methionine synthase activation subunit [Clostridia bacterium]|nr:Vitamin B12 dependent methionine synthase activation subunit [Clostridia bacterium]